MINYLLLKIASRCNFDCSYCYWFRDGSVRNFPAFMSDYVVNALLAALERHITRFRLSEFTCSFHGGEPTLFGAYRLRKFMQKIDAVAAKTNCDIRYALTTNGSLLDREWLEVIIEFAVSVTVSIDGPPEVHDGRRLTVKGAPTWRESVAGYLALCREGIKPSIIAVCDPHASPVAVLDHLVSDLGVRFCDVLIPDCNHTDSVVSIAPFYIGLFDHWYDKYSDSGVEVRILTELIRGLLGLQSRTESIGLAPTQTVCLSPTGALEPHDVLRIAGEDKTQTSCSIFTHELADIEADPLWKSVNVASTELCDTCRACRYESACGGGHIAQRWSPDLQYNNPSVYCSDFIRILDHVAGRIKTDIEISASGVTVSAEEIYSSLTRGEPGAIYRGVN